MGWLAFVRRWFTPREEREAPPVAPPPPAPEHTTPSSPPPAAAAKPAPRPVPPTPPPVQRGAPTIVPPKASQVVRPVDRVPATPTPVTPKPAGMPPEPARPPARAIEPATPPPRPPDARAPSATPTTVSPTAVAPPPILEPIKPSHRRVRTLDERLTPKASARQELSARRPSKRAVPAAEAARLFSATLRTQDRTARRLATDEAQLLRYDLPLWRTEADVARALEISVRTLRHFSMHSAQEQAPHYVTFAIAKRSGGERLIMAPKRRLKSVQRRLNTLLCSKLPVSEHAHGFRSRRSVRTNAEPHVGKRVLLQLDIHEFFPSIHFGRVRGLLLALGYAYPVASVLAALMTEAPRQPVAVGDTLYFPPVGSRACPQGAPTSPHVSNALLLKMDRRLAGLARKRGFAYTRYADDLSFSGDDIAQAHALRLLVTRVVEDEGFRINAHKTRIVRDGSRQCVTGVVVNDVLGLSRQARRRLRAAIHRYAQEREAGRADAAVTARLEGNLAYLSMLNADQARRLV